MGIFSRTRDIIAANVTDLLDKAEDPAKMIRMIIMEMEETLVEVRASAARTIADQKELRRSIVKLERASIDWAEKAELALSKDREDLAKAALIEKQKTGGRAAQLQAEVDLLADSLTSYEKDIQKLEAKLREARARQGALLQRLETANNRVRVGTILKGEKTADAFSRFDILERRVDDAEGRADAFALGETQTLESQFAELQASEAVEAELEQLKNRLTHQKQED
ncbi:phage shock protein PspA [Pacificimonas flava]|uniref:Phage shock protein A n=1 Tax=Pacificimonas flava TaxID=1234595 RepID=M2T8X1_9SPHN|nr:phage shock protein PspA [Pacificimonas flava]EMD82954.1 Phage shock protein A [Pacificimonas flava]MBB5280114.1 phage shock protein A [Pacificimonas flava]